MASPKARIRRLNTLPDLLEGRSMSPASMEARPKLTKLLNVTVQGSVKKGVNFESRNWIYHLNHN